MKRIRSFFQTIFLSELLRGLSGHREEFLPAARSR